MRVIYIAARYDRREEMCGYAKELRELGYEVNSRWLLGTHQIHQHAELIDKTGVPSDSHGVTLLARPFAEDDVADVSQADILIFFSEPPDSHSKRGGRHVEYGMALALQKKIIVIGDRENVFHCLPQVIRFDTWDDFKKTEVRRYSMTDKIREILEQWANDECLYGEAWKKDIRDCKHSSITIPSYCGNADAHYKCLMEKLKPDLSSLILDREKVGGAILNRTDKDGDNYFAMCSKLRNGKVDESTLLTWIADAIMQLQQSEKKKLLDANTGTLTMYGKSKPTSADDAVFTKDGIERIIKE